MPAFAPAYLATWTGGRWTAKPAPPLSGFTQDTRQLRAGQVFVAIKTDKRDGHEYLPTALSAGASAAIVSREDPSLPLPQLVVEDPLRAFQTIAREHRRAFRGAVVGVSGSCGKTSTKNLVAQLLGGEPHVLATEGNLNNHLGVPLTLTRLEPGSHESAVIEAGIGGPGEMALLADMVEPDYGIITLIAPAHTQELGGVEGVAREKAVLLQHVRPGGLSVFPQQCWEYSSFQDLPQPSIVAVPEGQHSNAPRAIAFNVRDFASGTEIALGARRRFQFRRVSRGMAQNAVLAVLLASELGVTDETIQRVLADWQPAKWRGEVRREGGRLMYLDFYNANPAAMADALEAFRAVALADEPRVYVLGCMEELGVDAPRYHRELGRALRLRAQDQLFVIGGDASSVVQGVSESGQTPAKIEIVTDLAPVAAHLAIFRGAVFMKGSRRYELEKALPPSEAPLSKGSSAGGSGPGTPGTASSFSRVYTTSNPLSWALPTLASRASAKPSANPFV
jgi:UDP-N-acetylmuramoyl-tripeptide--D-alanyl-D-alanine ligase